MPETHTIEFYDADGDVMERAYYVCSRSRALSAAFDRAELIGADDFDFAPDPTDDEDEMQEAA